MFDPSATLLQIVTHSHLVALILCNSISLTFNCHSQRRDVIFHQLWFMSTTIGLKFPPQVHYTLAVSRRKRQISTCETFDKTLANFPKQAFWNSQTKRRMNSSLLPQHLFLQKRIENKSEHLAKERGHFHRSQNSPTLLRKSGVFAYFWLSYSNTNPLCVFVQTSRLMEIFAWETNLHVCDMYHNCVLLICKCIDIYALTLQASCITLWQHVLLRTTISCQLKTCIGCKWGKYKICHAMPGASFEETLESLQLQNKLIYTWTKKKG